MDLKYHSDFWGFYQINQQEVNEILNFYSLKYIKIIEPQDMFQELIVRLARSDVLTKYKPSKKFLLKTYFVSRVKGYASHYYTKCIRKPITVPIEFYHTTIKFYTPPIEKGPEKKTKEKREKINVHSSHMKMLQDHVDHTKHPPFHEYIENTLYSMEIMALLKERLKVTHYYIASLYFIDCYTPREITAILKKYSYNTIIKRISEIKEEIKNIIHPKKKTKYQLTKSL